MNDRFSKFLAVRDDRGIILEHRIAAADKNIELKSFGLMTNDKKSIVAGDDQRRYACMLFTK